MTKIMGFKKSPAMLAAIAAVLCIPAYGQITATEVQKLLASDGSNDDGFGESVAIDGDTMVVGASALDDSGQAYVYTFDGNTWVETQKLTPSDGTIDDRFGGIVALDGDTAIIGAFLSSPNGPQSGSAYIYTFDGTTWVETRLTASDAAAGDLFGNGVAIDGNVAMIGAGGDDDNGSSSGSVYVYTFDGAAWTETQKLTAGDGAAGDGFGGGITIDDNVAMVGAGGDDDNGSSSGSVYVYTFDGAAWTETQKLTSSDGAELDRFGSSVAIDGNTVIVGAGGDDDNGDNSGSVYVYTFDGTAWTEMQKLTASDGAAQDYFGFAGAIDGNTVIVGAEGDDDQGEMTGAAYLYAFDGTAWTETQKLGPSGGTVAGSLFGSSVAIDGSTAMIGAEQDDENGEDSGAAYVFALNGPTNVQIDIKPGSSRNPVNLKSKGNIPVAILTSETFDATQVNWETVHFGPSGTTERHQRVHVKDADYDGDMDVVLHFKTRDTGILCGDTEATLTGETFSGEEFTGSDVIKIVKCPKTKKRR